MNSIAKKFIQTLQGQAGAPPPFWLMRQAGRYLPEYRALRQTAGSFLDLCFTPDFAAEVTLQPIRRFDMDAAILFSDILVVPYALGQELKFVEGEGPRLGALPVFSDVDFAAFDQKLSPVYATIRRVRAELSPDKTLIGFAGAPWTLACYMIQGKGDGEFAAAKKFALTQPAEFKRLMDRVTEATARYLIEQIKNGVDAVQIFDSWAGLLPEPFFKAWVIEPTRKIIALIHQNYPQFPIIGFPRGAGSLYIAYAEQTGVTGLGLDQIVSLPWARQNFGAKVCLQGNLDPVVLLIGGSVLEQETRRILETMRGTPFIFNLGHGVIKETPPEHVAQLAQIIRSF